MLDIGKGNDFESFLIFEFFFSFVLILDVYVINIRVLFVD